MRQINLILVRIIRIRLDCAIHTDGNRGRIDSGMAQSEVVEKLDITCTLEERSNLLPDRLHGLREVGDRTIAVSAAAAAEEHVDVQAFAQQVDQINVALAIFARVGGLNRAHDRVYADGLIAFHTLDCRKN